MLKPKMLYEMWVIGQKIQNVNVGLRRSRRQWHGPDYATSGQFYKPYILFFYHL